MVLLALNMGPVQQLTKILYPYNTNFSECSKDHALLSTPVFKLLGKNKIIKKYVCKKYSSKNCPKKIQFEELLKQSSLQKEHPRVVIVLLLHVMYISGLWTERHPECGYCSLWE